MTLKSEMLLPKNLSASWKSDTFLTKFPSLFLEIEILVACYCGVQNAKQKKQRWKTLSVLMI